MNVAIRYHAAFRYTKPVGFSPHTVRLFPRRDMAVRVIRAALSTHPGADVQHRQDLFDNLVATCFYPDPLDCLEFHLALDLALTPRNPFHFLLASHAIEMPFTYRPREAEVLAPYLNHRSSGTPLPEPLRPSPQPRPTVTTLVALNLWLHQHIAYERREDGDPLPVASTFARRKGSCRDFAAAMAEVLRTHGIAARLVSGFLWEPGVPHKDRRAENALHAWVEGYLPGAGWVGLDPTNGMLCDHHFLPTAIGLTPEDIAPIAGTYFGEATGALTATLRITEIP